MPTPDNPYTNLGSDYTGLLSGRSAEGNTYDRLKSLYKSRCKVLEDELGRCSDLVMLTNAQARICLDAWASVCNEFSIKPDSSSLREALKKLTEETKLCGNKVCTCRCRSQAEGPD